MKASDEYALDATTIETFERGRARTSTADSPIARIASSDLDILMSTLEVQVASLEERVLRNERCLEQGSDHFIRLYYGLCGNGSIATRYGITIAMAPHTFVLVPPVGRSASTLGSTFTETSAQREVVSGSMRLLCGRFDAAFGTSVALFGGLSIPIVERFEEADEMHATLRMALVEQEGSKPGSAAMTSALLKQVIVQLLRRSITSPNLWVERFAILQDHRIARAFAEMLARPGAPHTVESLARSACLSRSTFMARFFHLVGRAPMSVLRDLRMRQAAQQLRLSSISIGHVGRAAGYANNSGFIRAFRNAYGMDPREYRSQTLVGAARMLSNQNQPVDANLGTTQC